MTSTSSPEASQQAPDTRASQEAQKATAIDKKKVKFSLAFFFYNRTLDSIILFLRITYFFNQNNHLM